MGNAKPPPKNDKFSSTVEPQAARFRDGSRPAATTEPVDGPRIAAEILKKMPSADQKRLVEAIKQESPDVAVKIQENLYHFDDIAELTAKSVQTLVSQIAHSDLVLSLKTASETVKAAFFNNMSEGKRKQVQEDFAALPQVRLASVEEAQRRILDKLEDLRRAGLVHSAERKDIYA